MRRCPLVKALTILFLLCGAARAEAPIPAFGRDTVLVWKIANEGEPNAGTFVVRIAEFLPIALSNGKTPRPRERSTCPTTP